MLLHPCFTILSCIVLIGTVHPYHWQISQSSNQWIPNRTSPWDMFILLNPSLSHWNGQRLEKWTGREEEVLSPGSGGDDTESVKRNYGRGNLNFGIFDMFKSARKLAKSVAAKHMVNDPFGPGRRRRRSN